jgi:phytoene dehydrogenase-like protein
VLVSALDEELARTEARYGIEVFWKGFLASRGGYRIGIPSVPLAELYEGCREAVVKRGGSVELRAGARRVCVREGRFCGAVLEDGSEVSAEACVVAVAHDALPALLPKEMFDPSAPLEGLRHIRTSPITGVHLWFDRKVMKEPFLTLLDHTTQWVFNKSALYADRSHKGEQGDPATAEGGGNSTGQYLQLVTSASYDLVPRSRQEIIDLCRRELADVLPATRDAKLVKSTVIKEIHATFSPEPGIDRWRPGQNIGVENLHLAGDWTRTGWPSTMEGAVRSGYLAAESALTGLGRSMKFLKPDLPFEGFCKLWARREAESRRLTV